MLSRYNTLDIIVGVGMCAIVFGAMLFLFSTSDSFVVASTNPSFVETSSSVLAGTQLLQPALGQAVVDRTLLQERTDQMTAAAMSEWNQAIQAHRSLQAIQGDPFGYVMDRAAVFPVEHEARIQAVMGHSIVNFTGRGVRAGRLSANEDLSDFNRSMIGVTEAMGDRMERDFRSSWQPLLGQWIVDARQDYVKRAADVQEQLGRAIVHVVRARTILEDAWATNQYQLGSLMAVVDRTGAMSSGQAILVESEGTGEDITVASTHTVSWPEVPTGYLILAMLALCTVFFGGVILSAASRDAKALAEAKRNAGRWVYRIAA